MSFLRLWVIAQVSCIVELCVHGILCNRYCCAMTSMALNTACIPIAIGAMLLSDFAHVLPGESSAHQTS